MIVCLDTQGEIGLLGLNVFHWFSYILRNLYNQVCRNRLQRVGMLFQAFVHQENASPRPIAQKEDQVPTVF